MTTSHITFQHSARPWTAEPVREGYAQHILSAEGYQIALVSCEGAEYRDAEARLMAAAPDLLDACREALRFVTDPDVADAVEAAIARATGAAGDGEVAR